MKKIFSFVVVMAAVAMVSCCGNSNKKAAQGEAAAVATEASACAGCDAKCDAEACDSSKSCCAEKCDSTKSCCAVPAGTLRRGGGALQPLLTTGGCGLFIISDMCRVFS